MARITYDNKFDFNDILIIPSKTTKINSRYNDVTLPNELPLLTAAMDTVVNVENAEKFKELGVDVIIPRTHIKNWDDFIYFSHICNNNDYFVSVGLDIFKEFSKIKLNGIYPKKILLDIANGHIEEITNMCKNIKSNYGDVDIMVGSIANPETYRWFAESGVVDYVRCGIGAGNGCLTTKNSSIGYPMASLILECNIIKETLKSGGIKKLPAIVADGGMKDYSDIIKALGLGADYVLLGSIFNKALESAGNNYFMGIKISNSLARKLYFRGFPIKKYFRGMSTKEAQKAMGKKTLKTSEGVVRYRNVEYTLSGWVENFRHYLRNAMSYSNSKTLDDFIGKADFCKITEFSYKRFDK